VYTSPPPKMKILKFLVMKIGNNIYWLHKLIFREPGA
jgi:hypothetical protein